MSDYWKLNIKDYTLHEIYDLFGLKEPHTLEEIINADLSLTERIKTDDSIDNDKKKQILAFLSKAKEKLLEEQKKNMAKLVKTTYSLTEANIWFKIFHMIDRSSGVIISLA